MELTDQVELADQTGDDDDQKIFSTDDSIPAETDSDTSDEQLPVVQAGDEQTSIEQTQEPMQVRRAASSPQLAAAYRLADELYAALQHLPNGDLAREIVATSLRLLRDGTQRGDLKLITRSLKELWYALKVFAPYHEVRKVSIFGSARTPEEHPDYQQALAFGQGMAEAGWMVLTGGGGGIMAAGHGGAGPGPSFGLAIRLPFEQQTNPFIAGNSKLINFRYFFTRKVMFLRGSHAVALFPGGFGTLDEGFEVLTLMQTGRAVPMPIVFVDQPGGDYWRSWQEYITKHLLQRGLIGPDDARLYRITDSVPEAMQEIQHFYSNFHSVRYVARDLVLRLQRHPTAQQLSEIETSFADIVVDGGFRLSGPLPEEHDEPVLAPLARLVFTFNRRDYARLRMLIDHLNNLPN